MTGYGDMHYCAATAFCAGGRNDTGDWKLVTCPWCLRSAPEPDSVQVRPETGAMQFEGDWSGIFIRGDNALGYSLALERFLRGERGFVEAEVACLLSVLRGSNEHQQSHHPQLLKKWKECQRDG